MNTKKLKKPLPIPDKTKKFNILKTFEIFNKEKINIFKDKIIEIILIETDNIFSKNNMFKLDLKKNNSVKISVFNDRQTYDLLSNTWKRYKTKHKKLKENDKNNKSRIFN